MIPKIIHYCWLSDDPIPEKLQQYIDGWSKVMPDYKIKKWDKKAFDIHSISWVEEAYNNRKWAFAADYIRAYALYTEGGFYLDSDVKVFKKFDDFLDYGFVSSIEYDHAVKAEMMAALDENSNRLPSVTMVKGLGIQAAIMGCEKGHPFMKDVMSRYQGKHFVNEDGSFNQQIAPVVYSLILEKWGFRYLNTPQFLDDNVAIFDSSVFAGYQTVSFGSTAVHMCAGSWTPKTSPDSLLSRLKKVLFIRKVCNLLGL